MNHSIFREPPSDFNAVLEAAGCYCFCNDNILFLKRHPNKHEGNTWGIPGGKLEALENPRMAVIREVREEVGLEIDSDDLQPVGRIYCRLPDLDYIFHLFKKPFEMIPQIELALDEHLEYRWVTVAEAQALPLMMGGPEALGYYVKHNR